jgi:hypothetical protein
MHRTSKIKDRLLASSRFCSGILIETGATMVDGVWYYDFAGWGLKEIVLTHKDGMLLLVDGQIYEAPFLPEPMVGRRGRGPTHRDRLFF